MNEKLPAHVAIIMDGNRRWAKEKGLPSVNGHAKGADMLKEVGSYILSKGIKYLSVFAFSTENFTRDEKEVKYLMDMIVKEFTKNIDFFMKKDIKIIFSGREYPLREDVLDAMELIKDKTKDNSSGVLNICINYGGQQEIVDATKKIHEDVKSGKIGIEDIDVTSFSKYLYQDLPAIDLLIRTSGEIRVSNYMLYQLAYAELYFTNVYFPDFNAKEFDKAMDEYFKRNRRYGGN